MLLARNCVPSMCRPRVAGVPATMASVGRMEATSNSCARAREERRRVAGMRGRMVTKGNAEGVKKVPCCNPKSSIVGSNTHIVDHAHAATQQAGVTDHGGALEPWSAGDPRDSGDVSRNRAAGLHDDPNYCVSHG